MRTRLSALLIGIMATSVLTSAVPAWAAGKYVLAWWREKGYYENCGGGCRVLHVYVFDEAGNPMPSVPVYTTAGEFLGNTKNEQEAKGWMEWAWPLYDHDDRDARIGAPGTVDSDVTPVMAIAKYPQYDHYSYDCGFMYKSDVSNPGQFDLTMNCTVNPAGSTETDIPYTNSLIYYSAICEDWMSDHFWFWQDGGVFAQTFVVPPGVDRIIGVRPLCAIGLTYELRFTAEIREGSPTGTLVCGPKQSNLVYPFANWQWLPFGVNECPVTPGGTYCLVLSRPGPLTLNAAYCNNVYASGQAYQNGVPFSGRDLFGFIVGASYETTTIITSPTLAPGWHLISLPAEPSDPSPSVVFDGINIDHALYRWKPATASYVMYETINPGPFGDCQVGEGYWLDLSAPATISYQGTPSTGTQHVSLPSGGWRMIGQPHMTATPLANCTVTDLGGGGTQTYYEAALDGWLAGRMYYYDPSAGGYLIAGPDPWNASNGLTPWFGYWLRSAEMNLTLDIPEP